MKCPSKRTFAKKTLLVAALFAVLSPINLPAFGLEDTAGSANSTPTLLKGSLQQSEQLDWLAKVGITAAPKPTQPRLLMVSAVQQGSPAYYGGVAANDHISAIDAKDGFLKVTIDRSGHFYQASIKADFLQGRNAQIGSTALKGIVGQTRLGGASQYNQAPVTLKQQMPTSGVTHPYSANAIALDGAAGVEQARYPDCWFLGTLAALANLPRGQQMICEMIAVREPGYYFVKFPGADEVVTESADDRANFSLNNRADWANLLEAAALQKYNSLVVANSGPGGKASLETAMHFLTGLPSISVSPDTLTPVAMEDLLDRLQISGTPVVVGTRNSRELHSRSPLTENHCYTVMSFDRSTDIVTLRNCYGDEPRGDSRMGVQVRGGGLVDLSLADFQRYVRWMCYSSR